MADTARNTAAQEYARAPIIEPWKEVKQGENVIPFLQQTRLENVQVQRTRYAGDTLTKKVNFLLVTHSDGIRLVGDNERFSVQERVDENTPRHNNLMCDLGGKLAFNLDIAPKNNNSAAKDTWYVLAQLPTGYLAFYRARTGEKHLDVHIVGHASGKTFASVSSFADHLGWLATADEGSGQRCDCKLCTAEYPGKQRNTENIEKQLARKKRCIDWGSPTWEGLPEWWTEAEDESSIREERSVQAEEVEKGEDGDDEEDDDDEEKDDERSEDEVGNENETDNEMDVETENEDDDDKDGNE